MKALPDGAQGGAELGFIDGGIEDLGVRSVHRMQGNGVLHRAVYEEHAHCAKPSVASSSSPTTRPMTNETVVSEGSAANPFRF